MKTTNFFYLIIEFLTRYENYFSYQHEPVYLKEVSSEQYFLKLESEIDLLHTRVKELEKENVRLQDACKQKDQRIHDMEIMVSVFEKMVPQINIFHADKAEQINGVIESGAKVSHTQKTNDYDTE